MQSQLAVRLPEELDKEIAELAIKMCLKRSDIVRMALERFVKEFRYGEETRPYDNVKSLIGSVTSGVPDLGAAHRKHLLKRFGKHA